MSQYQTGDQPPAMAPPQYPGDIPQQRSSWPTVLGILLIVLASLGLLTNLCGGVASVMMPAMMSSGGEADDPVMAAQADLTRRYIVFNLSNSIIMIGLGIVLLIAGIGLTRRRRSAPKLTKIWAVVRILWALPAAYATYVITVESIEAMEEAAAQGGQAMPAGMAAIMQSIGPVAVVFNLALWCAVPVFVLIWFSRVKIKNEIANWS